MTNMPPALAMRNSTMSVPNTVLGMHTHNVNIGVWCDIYQSTYRIVAAFDAFSHVSDIASMVANDAWFHLRHEP